MGLAAAVLLSVGAGGGAVATEVVRGSQQTATAFTPRGGTGFGDGTGFSGGSAPDYGSFGGPASGSTSGDSGSQSTAGTGTAATAAQTVGVVTIDSTLGYESAEAAGTGIVLTSTGRILTNNHVVEGSTSLKVTDETTGTTYTATVVGTDATDDIAVLQLKNASGLQTADLASSSASVGDAVTGVGNAGGTGSLTTASGTVTALEQSITTAAEGSAASEQLTGLIETDADILSGDSGGPLIDSDGDVVGIDTAASSGTADVTGYAIPIEDAMTIAEQIVAGDDTDTITIGYPAFLGVAIAATGPSADTTTGDGATIGQIIDGTPAATAGLEAGDTITAIDGTSIASGDELTDQLGEHSPGDSVTVGFTSTDGDSHTVTVTLTTGPAA